MSGELTAVLVFAVTLGIVGGLFGWQGRSPAERRPAAWALLVAGLILLCFAALLFLALFAFGQGYAFFGRLALLAVVLLGSIACFVGAILCFRLDRNAG